MERRLAAIFAADVVRRSWLMGDDALIESPSMVGAMGEMCAASVTPFGDELRCELLDKAERVRYKRAREVVRTGERILQQDVDYCPDFQEDSIFHRTWGASRR